MTPEELIRLNFDRSFKAPKWLIGPWAAVASVYETKILVVMDTEYDLGSAQLDAEYVMNNFPAPTIESVSKAVGRRSIRHHNGQIKFQATNMPGQGLGRDWFVLYSEES